jgi:uncharacterized protein (TIGR03067 family)
MTSALFFLAVTVAAPAPKDPPPKAAPSLEGEWVAIALVEGGASDRVPAGTSLTFTADRKCLMKEGTEKPEEVEVTLNAKLQPAEIDFVLPSGGMKPDVMRGIYKIDGDILTICLNHQPDRPKDFVSPAGTSVTLITLVRATKE